MARGENMKRSLVLLLSIFAVSVFAEKVDIPWDMEELNSAPNFYPAESFDNDGIEALYFDGPIYKGGVTKVFAYMGKPDKVVGQSPGVVLVHGGGGTACARWVRIWNKRGYAAIALDTTGSIPDGEFPAHKRHADAGPPGWGGFDQLDEDIKEQWTYHAVADIILANSLLSAQLDVDRYQIGVVGISWGGYLTCIAAAVDERFDFAVPIYGCGYLQRDSHWAAATFPKLGKERADKWAALWDPSSYLYLCDLPVLFVNGLNDPFYPLSSMNRSCSAVDEAELCIIPDLTHSHAAAFEIEEVYAFADSVCKGGDSLVLLARQYLEERTASVEFWSDARPESALLYYTDDGGPWKSRKWQTAEAQINYMTSTISADIPKGARLYFFNVKDKRGLITSTRYRAAPK